MRVVTIHIFQIGNLLQEHAIGAVGKQEQMFIFFFHQNNLVGPTMANQ